VSLAASGSGDSSQAGIPVLCWGLSDLLAAFRSLSLQRDLARAQLHMPLPWPPWSFPEGQGCLLLRYQPWYRPRSTFHGAPGVSLVHIAGQSGPNRDRTPSECLLISESSDREAHLTDRLVPSSLSFPPSFSPLSSPSPFSPCIPFYFLSFLPIFLPHFLLSISKCGIPVDTLTFRSEAHTALSLWSGA
jgi:hypothetical protein